MELLAGIDLHSNNGYLGIADLQGKRVYDKKLPNELPKVLAALEPYREELKGVIVESTYNWYWLVDGLMDHGYPVFLANPTAIEPYSGLKNIDDKSSAFFLIELKRLGILPTGYIYPKAQRAVRDLLRRRRLLVQQRTSHLLSFNALVARQTGSGIHANTIKKLTEEEIKRLLGEEKHSTGGSDECGNHSVPDAANSEDRIGGHEESSASAAIQEVAHDTGHLEDFGIDDHAGNRRYPPFCRRG
jgi:hypothetical protein